MNGLWNKVTHSEEGVRQMKTKQLTEKLEPQIECRNNLRHNVGPDLREVWRIPIANYERGFKRILRER